MIDKINWKYWRALYDYYDKSLIYIELNGEITEEIKINGGVKQGGPLSPKLYNTYVKSLIKRIEEINMGARIGNVKISILVYADDIMLVSPVKIGIAKMLIKTQEYMEEWKIKINLDKTNYIQFGRQKIIDYELIVNEIKINRVKTMKYLGMTFDEKLNFNEHVKERTKKCMKAVYGLHAIGLLSRSMDLETKQYIYKTYCRPVLTYGFDIINVNEKEEKKIRTDEAILLKRILNVKKTSKNTLMYQTMKIREPIYNIYKMKSSLYNRLQQNIVTKSLTNALIIEQMNLKINILENTLIEEMIELTNALNIKTMKKKKEIEKKFKIIEKEEYPQGLIDSIKYCINKRYEDNKIEKTLNLLIKGY
jgi:hypothetical protein